MVIAFYSILVLCILLIILGCIIFIGHKDKLIIRLNNKSIPQDKIKDYTRIVGIGYIITGISVIPLILIGIDGCAKYQYLGELFWLMCCICFYVTDYQSKKKFGHGIYR